MPVPCPACGHSHKPGLAFCSNCGAAVGRCCPQCNRPAEKLWNSCGYCGARLA
jgi:hypothetical protein